MGLKYDGSAQVPSLQRTIAAAAVALRQEENSGDEDNESEDDDNPGLTNEVLDEIFPEEFLVTRFDDAAATIERAGDLVPEDALHKVQEARLALEAATAGAAKLKVQAPESILGVGQGEYDAVLEHVDAAASKDEAVGLCLELSDRAMKMCNAARHVISKHHAASSLRQSLRSGVLVPHELADTKRQLRRIGGLGKPPRPSSSATSGGLPDALWAIEHILGAKKFAYALKTSCTVLSNCTVFVVSDDLFQDELFWRQVKTSGGARTVLGRTQIRQQQTSS